MTFKHTKFEDSVTMRSLEKLAKEKGLIKTNLLEKIASGPKKSSKIDLTPTNNLTENLLKLCSGLRNSGMEKYAEELETTFMMYKQASTVCDSDLVDQAHPDGSPSLEGVQGDAVIETILDQQLAMIRMVEKKPTGKLTNAKSIINAVKISLGEVDTEMQEKGKQLLLQSIASTKRGLNALANVFYGPLLEKSKKGLGEWHEDLDAIKAELDSVDVNVSGVPNSIIHKLGGTLHSINTWIMSAYRSVEQGGGKAKVDDVWWKGFTAAKASIDNGMSLSWAAAKAFSGDNAGVQFHSQHVPADDVRDIISINLVRPLSNISTQLSQLDINSLDEDRKSKAQNAINEVASAVISAKNAASGVMALVVQQTDLRVIPSGKIGGLFSPPLSGEFNVNSLEQLKSKCNNVVSQSKRYLDTIQSWIK